MREKGRCGRSGLGPAGGMGPYTGYFARPSGLSAFLIIRVNAPLAQAERSGRSSRDNRRMAECDGSPGFGSCTTLTEAPRALHVALILPTLPTANALFGLQLRALRIAQIVSRSRVAGSAK